MGRITFPKQYPLKPPAIEVMTPNGRFQVNRKICMSISNHHPESWNPAWNVQTILIGLISFFVSDELTAGCIKTTDQAKRHLAKESLDYNLNKLSKFKDLFFNKFEQMGVFEIFEERKALKRSDNGESDPLLEGGGSANSAIPEEYVEKRQFLCCFSLKCGLIFFGLFLVFYTIIECFNCYMIGVNDYFSEDPVYDNVYAACVLGGLVASAMFLVYLISKDSRESRELLPWAFLIAAISFLVLGLWIIIYIFAIYPKDKVYI